MNGSPPGGGTFSLEGRPAPGLYVAAWVLAGIGVLLLFVGFQAGPPARGVLIMTGLLAVAAGLAAAAGHQVLARRQRPVEAYRGPAPLIVFGLYFVLVNAFVLALTVLGLDLLSPIGIAIGLAVQAAAFFVIVWLFAVRTGALRWLDLDLGRPWRAGRLIGDVLVGAGLMLPATFIILLVTALVFMLLGVSPPDVVPVVREPVEIALVGLAVVLLVPIGEELFFRGFVLTAWLRDLGERTALLRSSLFFALYHIVNIQAPTFDDGARQALGVVVVILPIGVILGLLFTRRGLMAAIAAHVAYNGIGYFGRLLAEMSPPPTP